MSFPSTGGADERVEGAQPSAEHQTDTRPERGVTAEATDTPSDSTQPIANAKGSLAGPATATLIGAEGQSLWLKFRLWGVMAAYAAAGSFFLWGLYWLAFSLVEGNVDWHAVTPTTLIPWFAFVCSISTLFFYGSKMVMALWNDQPFISLPSPSPRRITLAQELTWVTVFFFYGLGAFSFLMAALAASSAIHITESEGAPMGYLAISALLLWHLLDLIPLLEATETAGWTEPGNQRDAWAGSLVVGYKLFAVAIVIVGIRSIIARHRRSPRAT